MANGSAVEAVEPAIDWQLRHMKVYGWVESDMVVPGEPGLRAVATRESSGALRTLAPGVNVGRDLLSVDYALAMKSKAVVYKKTFWLVELSVNRVVVTARGERAGVLLGGS